METRWPGGRWVGRKLHVDGGVTGNEKLHVGGCFVIMDVHRGNVLSTCIMYLIAAHVHDIIFSCVYREWRWVEVAGQGAGRAPPPTTTTQQPPQGHMCTPQAEQRVAVPHVQAEGVRCEVGRQGPVATACVDHKGQGHPLGGRARLWGEALKQHWGCKHWGCKHLGCFFDYIGICCVVVSTFSQGNTGIGWWCYMLAGVCTSIMYKCTK